MKTPEYYNNSKGTLYKVATERGWNAYLFDVVKRLERGGKKDPLKQEIEKSIAVLELWLSELPNEDPEVYHMTKAPKIGTRVFAINSVGNLINYDWANDEVDNKTLDRGDVFATRELRNKELERRKNASKENSNKLNELKGDTETNFGITEEVYHMTEAPEFGTRYWVITSAGEPLDFEWNNYVSDNKFLNRGDAFATKELRDKELKRRQNAAK